MQEIEIRLMPILTSQVRSLCGFLGSFDPPHKGHEWIVEKLLERFDVVLLLIPAFHFEKTVRFPLNATFEQRLEMLAILSKREGNRIAVGLTHEVLFIRLADCLSQRFPSAEVSFGMGNETFEKVLASKTYYAHLGLPWTTEEQAKLERLRKKIAVFGRSSNNGHFISVPEDLRQLSSTRVREIVMELRKTSVPETVWQKRLEKMIYSEVLTFILQENLYSYY